jgi:two-component system cell cycle response regulator CpdR
MPSILLADDDASMRQYLARALERSGYAVTAVEDGPEALDRLADHRFDLLLTDIVMPGMDGIELARRAGERHPAMRVMFITGFAAVTLEHPDMPADARVFSKPFHLRDLVAEVDRLFLAARAVDA